MKVFGQLEKAQLENTTSDTGSLPKGMITYRTDSNLPKVSNGTSMIALIDESSTQTMSGKTIGGGLGFAQIATPSAPSAGNSKFYPKSDGKFYFMNSDGVEQEVGSGSGGGQGGKNYVPNKGSFNAGTVGWAAFNTTFSSDVPTTITAGSTKVAISLETTAPLSDAGSMKFSITTASGSAGHGVITDAMTIDDADLARVFEVTADYLVKAGAANLDLSGTATSTLEFWVYNVGLATWTQLVNFRPLTASIASTAKMSFQTSIENTSNKNQYRLALIVKNDALGTADLLLDTVYFGRGSSSSMSVDNVFSVGRAAAQSIPLTTQTTVLFDTVGTNTKNSYNPLTGELTIYESGYYLVAAQTYWSAFSGYTYTYIVKNSTTVSSAEDVNDASYGVSTLANAVVRCNAGDVLKVDAYQASAGAQNINGDASAVFFNVVKVSGTASAGTGTDIAMLVIGPTSTITGSASDVTGWGTPEVDSVSGFNPTTGVYTVKESAVYGLAGTLLLGTGFTTGNFCQLELMVNGSVARYWQERAGTGQGYMQVAISGDHYFKAGDEVKLKIWSDATSPVFAGGAQFNFFSLVKKSGGASAGNATSVNCKVFQTSGQSLPDSTDTKVTWNSVSYDSSGVFSANKFIAPESGVYAFKGVVQLDSLGSAYGCYSALAINGALSEYHHHPKWSSLSQPHPINFNHEVKLNAGEYVELYINQQSGGSNTVSTGIGGGNFATFTKVGN